MIRVEAHKSDVRAVAVGQRHIYSAGRDCTVSAWSVEDETLSRRARTTIPDWVMSLETFDDDNVRSSTSKYDSQTGAGQFFFANVGNDKRVAVGCRDGNIYFLHWDDSISPSKLVMSERAFEADIGPVCSLHISRCKSMLLSGSWDGQAILWTLDKNSDTSRIVGVFSGHENNVCALFLRSWPPLVVTGSAGLQVEGKLVGHQLRLWSPVEKEHLGTWKVEKSITAHDAGIRSLCAIGMPKTENDVAFASAGNDSTVRLFSICGDPIGSVARIPGDAMVLCVSYIHSSHTLAAVDDHGQISIIDASNGSIRCTVSIEPGCTIWSVAVGEAPHMKGKIAIGTSGHFLLWLPSDAEELVRVCSKVHTPTHIESSSVVVLPFTAQESYSGRTPGALSLFQMAKGDIAVYRWCTNGEWLFEGPMQSPHKRQELNGRLFDVVLPVEIESASQGSLSLQLGINTGDDLNRIAKEFCCENGLNPEEYAPQIKHFIEANGLG